ncbi:hypothetical protein SLA2020_408530 [Shorea laevis]
MRRIKGKLVFKPKGRQPHATINNSITSIWKQPSQSTRMEEAEKGLQMKEPLGMEEALHQEQPGQGQKKEEALPRMEEKKGLEVEGSLALHLIEAEQGLVEETPHRIESEMGVQMEEALAIHGMEVERTLHPMEAEVGLLQMEEALAIHGMEVERTLHPMEAEVGLLQMEETRAVHGVEVEQETLHWMESEMGLQMAETLIHLLEAVVAEKRAETSRMRDEWLEMEAAVETEGNELEFLKTNRDRCVAEQLLLQDAEQLLHDILFPPN